MLHRKLAVLLTSAALLASSGLVVTIAAQANTQVGDAPQILPNTMDKLQVASVVQHIESDSATQLMTQSTLADNADTYFIQAAAGRLKTVIQVVPQDRDIASLFVNGTEIFRFYGTVNEQSAYERVKSAAHTLKASLVEAPEGALHIHATGSHLQYGSTVLGEVDQHTVKGVRGTAPELAYLFTNRLRQSLGQIPLPAPKIAPDSDVAKAKVEVAYKGFQRGEASWYGPSFHGHRTASGCRYNQFAMTAAHRSLPFGTLVRVTNQRNHKSCVVQINDRGPFARGRVIDLSKSAASAIGMSGVAKVSLELISHS